MSFTGPATASSGTIATVSTAATTFFNAATNVYGRYVYNASTARIYVNFGTAASSSNFTFTVAANTGTAFPVPTYSGVVSGRWDNADAAGTAYTTQW